jgi:hypothetical protein
MSAPKLVKFTNAAGVPCYYARVNAGYGDLSKCQKTRTRRLHPAFLAELEAVVQEINWTCFGYLGELRAITSGGAYVNKPGWHSKGKAYDLGGLHWKGHADNRAEYANQGHILTCLEVAKRRDELSSRGDLLLYLAVESVLRKRFGTVLGMHYNRRHWNHWHFDPGQPVGYWESTKPTTRVRYVQEVLIHVWGIGCGNPDGEAGDKTHRALGELRRFGIGELRDPVIWQQFLTLTAMSALQLRSHL